MKTKMCECGCGGIAPISPKTNAAKGYIKGSPRRFIHGHHMRVLSGPERPGTKHGLGNSPTNRSYWSMRRRCTYPASNGYENYGGRGITVCDRWLTPGSQGFLNFLADMGERPEGKTLDRIDPEGNYEPGNCRWTTPKEQAANKRPKVCSGV